MSILVSKAERREDAMLDKIRTLVQKREAALSQMDAWEATDPTLQEIFNDIRLHLL